MSLSIQIFNVCLTNCDASIPCLRHSFPDHILNVRPSDLILSDFYTPIISHLSGWKCFPFLPSAKSPSQMLQLTSTSFRPIFLFPTVSHSIFSTPPSPYIFFSLLSLFLFPPFQLFFPYFFTLSIFHSFPSSFPGLLPLIFFFLLQFSSLHFLLFLSPLIPFSFFPLSFSSHPFYFLFSFSIYFISPALLHGGNSHLLALPSPALHQARQCKKKNTIISVCNSQESCNIGSIIDLAGRARQYACP